MRPSDALLSWVEPGGRARIINSDGKPIKVDTRVRVDAGTLDETRGIVVDDFGETAGRGVVVGDVVIVEPARRWAVRLDDGVLIFVDSARLTHD